MDARKIDIKKELPFVDLLWFSPSCIKFSKAGKNDGERGKEQLWKYPWKYIKTLEPSAFCMEQTDNMVLDAQHKKVFLKMCKMIEEMETYEIWYGILVTADYGIPQNRSRLYLVGKKRMPCRFLKNDAINELMPPPVIPCIPLRDLLTNGLPEDDPPSDAVGLPNFLAANWVLDLHGTKPNIREEQFPTITATRASRPKTYWLTAVQRWSNLTEILRMQGIGPDFKRVGVSDNAVGTMAGNAVSVNVAMALFRQLLAGQ